MGISLTETERVFIYLRERVPPPHAHVERRAGAEDEEERESQADSQLSLEPMAGASISRPRTSWPEPQSKVRHSDWATQAPREIEFKSKNYSVIKKQTNKPLDL